MASTPKDLTRSRAEGFIPLVAGGVGGTTGAILTCPLEVVKTRLQSSNSGFPSTPDEMEKARREFLAQREAMRKGGAVSGAPPTSSTSSSGPSSGSSSRGTNSRVHSRILPEAVAKSQRIRGPPASWRGWNRALAETPGRQTSARHLFGNWDLVVRLNSSSSTLATPVSGTGASKQLPPSPSPKTSASRQLSVFQCLRYIYLTEGVFGLFRGIGPNLMGVAPSRAIYFWAYSTAKSNINASLPRANRDTPFVHIISAMSAGLSASTVTNPIWLIKTRLQLDRASGIKSMSFRNCFMEIYTERGFLGFWRGVTASYWGISETVIHFVIYEALKKQVMAYQNKHKNSEKSFIDFAGFMLCGACSKTCATCIAYPHEVARTRLREAGTRYKSFWQTLGIVYREEGRRGLYRGLGTQLIRQIPNTAIMMSTYELTVYVMLRWLRDARDPARKANLVPSSSSVVSDRKSASS